MPLLYIEVVWLLINFLILKDEGNIGNWTYTFGKFSFILVRPKIKHITYCGMEEGVIIFHAAKQQKMFLRSFSGSQPNIGKQAIVLKNVFC